MPSRWLRWLIVLCWFTSTGWLFWHDLLPNLRPGEPPPFHIDPVDEVQKGAKLETEWIVQRQLKNQSSPQDVFVASTWVDYHSDDDTCTLHALLDAKRRPGLQPFYVAKIFKIEKLTSEYRVTRSGQLRSLRAEVKATPDPKRLGEELSPFLRSLFKSRATQSKQETSPSHEPMKLRVWGEVIDDQFFAHCSGGSDTLANPLQFDLPPTPLSHTSSVLMPLHPVNRIRGLRPGHSWRQPLVDPLRDAFAALPGFSGGVRSLQAHVLPETKVLERDNIRLNCLVIEYSDEEHEVVGRTWVEQDSEQVQQQEALLEDGQWIIKRDSQHRRLRGPS